MIETPSAVLPSLPPVRWTHDPGVVEVRGQDLVLTAAAGVDWTNDATGAPAQHRATSLSFPVGDEDFQLSARVSVDRPRSTFDAAVLTIWADAEHWAKLCFEWSPQGEAMVVSVVTDGYSDDANGPVIDGDAVWLRVSKVGRAFVFHYSTDGALWHFVRLFRLGTDLPPVVGLMSQAPLGDRAVARFSHVSLTPGTLADLRDGR